MAPPNSQSPDDDFFNDLSRRHSGGEGSIDRSRSPKTAGSHAKSIEDAESYVPRTKRIACVVCRKRKLKCDGTKPSCGTCARLGHHCAYDEVRKKSGPKRGYVKHLEARLAQVETLLKTQDPVDPTPSSTFPEVSGIPLPHEPADDMAQLLSNTGEADPGIDDLMDTLAPTVSEAFSWELIGLGLEEPLPSQEAVDDMHRIYFDKVHPSMPIIHRPRYYAAMDLPPNMRPPVCLRYAMWTHVCSITPKYSALTDHFYARARKYAEQDEMKGFGESMITVSHSQCWSLIAAYEFKRMYFPRAWMSVGRAARLSQMMSLDRQDGPALDVKQTIPPPRDWTEREERRRTFWLAFCQDRYASVGTGWSMQILEKDIASNLPSSEEAFLKSKPETSLPLAEVMTTDGAASLSPFGGVVLMACLFGRNLNHLHRTDGESDEHDLNGEFWKRHRALDNILLNTSLSLPYHLRLPAGIHDANIVFVNMNIHASTICLHQAAIFKADKNNVSRQISVESKRRCIIAADQIANIMRMVSHVDLATMNPFIAFCLYVAGRVFVQFLKTNKNDATVMSSLQFLLGAMHAMKAMNPLTESFLVELDIEMEASGLTPLFSNSESTQPRRPSAVRNLCGPVKGDLDGCISVLSFRSDEGRQQASVVNLESPPILADEAANAGRQMNFSRTSPTHGQAYTNLADRRKDSPLSLVPEPAFGGVSYTYEDTSYIVDMEPSFENSINQRYASQSSSGQPTPSISSNNNSSHTSFNPLSPDDHSKFSNMPPATGLSPNIATSATAFGNSPEFSTFDQTNLVNATVPNGMSSPFAIPSSWSHADIRQSSANPAGKVELNGARAAEVPSWQSINVMEGNEGLFSNWN